MDGGVVRWPVLMDPQNRTVVLGQTAGSAEADPLPAVMKIETHRFLLPEPQPGSVELDLLRRRAQTPWFPQWFWVGASGAGRASRKVMHAG